MSDRIARAREAEKILRLRFEAEKQVEWVKVSSQARNEVESAVWEAYISGTPVTQIATQYGTKNRGTIYEIINKRKQFEALTPEVVKPAESSWSVEVMHEAHPSGRTQYRVQTERTWTGGAHTATLNVWDGEPWFDDTDTTTPLHTELRDNWATSPIAAHIKELEAQQR